ncbi:hypothetical protein HYH03_017943 [Edaphochlamys debaryana]|uniref:Cyclin-D1-binding protein 1-like N-terminal domain-containing protein n=1 Tax=Edaphochlamys debaryana TaxID=47281 RepID=A0A835XG80_9CHLO|nr:hypothetical protein HYH03_017943 [Edaphochlamys debaryana]|eukprot:KAG2483151.1 hypothetical protein HYH03_017943 [Edaphochlamys debaryana]
MAPSAWPVALEAAIDTVDAALAVFEGPPCTAGTPPGGRDELKALAEAHKQQAAKAALLTSGGGGEAAAGGALRLVESSCVAVTSYAHGFTSGAGPSLAAGLRGAVGAVVGATKELMRALNGGDANELRRLVGRVWGACDELAASPLDNRALLFRRLADAMGGVKSAAKELDELVDASRAALGAEGEGPGSERTSPSASPARTSAAAAAAAAAAEEAGAGAGAGSDGEDEDEGGSEGSASGESDPDDFTDMGTLSAAELRTASAAQALLAAAQGVLRAVSRPLLEGPAVSSEHCLDDWESMVWHGGKLRSAVEALVAGLYPPHDDLPELRGDAEAVASTLELMGAEMPDAYASEAVAAALEAAQRAVDVAEGRMKDALERAARRTSGAGVGASG